jgi:sigma-B regulation protein RsbU (phosphoserine phosphatase)
MKVLIAEDDVTTNAILEAILENWGYEVVITRDGAEAWAKLQEADAPKLVILDRMMPKMDGLEVCRRIRKKDPLNLTYIIHLTTLAAKDDVVAGLGAGANDYITKPFNNQELRARVAVGAEMVKLQVDLADKVEELEQALAHIKQLQGVLPICSYCHKIRDDKEVWQKLEAYVEHHSDARFSHSYCPECLDKYYPEET